MDTSNELQISLDLMIIYQISMNSILTRKFMT